MQILANNGEKNEALPTKNIFSLHLVDFIDMRQGLFLLANKID